jgi:hypothetical protein
MFFIFFVDLRIFFQIQCIPGTWTNAFINLPLPFLLREHCGLYFLKVPREKIIERLL